MDDKEFDFIRTVDRPTIAQLRREIQRMDAARNLTSDPDEDRDEPKDQDERPDHRSSRKDSHAQKQLPREEKEKIHISEDFDNDEDDDEEEDVGGKKRKHPVLKVILIILLTVLVLAIGSCVYLVMQYGYVVYGTSMAPSLVEGDLVLAIPKSVPVTGDLISFNNGDRVLIKRAIACPGDEISVDEDGHVILNGIELNEPYAMFTEAVPGDIEFPLTVPDNCYFVLGDNRANSVDSRYSVLGMVNVNEINGRIFLRAWPMQRFQVFDKNFIHGFLNIFKK